MLLATISKHDIGGIIAILVGIAVLGLGLARAAIRTALLFLVAIVIVVGILLVTRAI